MKNTASNDYAKKENEAFAILNENDLVKAAGGESQADHLAEMADMAAGDLRHGIDPITPMAPGITPARESRQDPRLSAGTNGGVEKQYCSGIIFPSVVPVYNPEADRLRHEEEVRNALKDLQP